MPRNTTPALVAHMRKSAERAVDDPAKLAQAARIVRAALARKVLTDADLHGDVVRPADLVGGDAA